MVLSSIAATEGGYVPLQVCWGDLGWNEGWGGVHLFGVRCLRSSKTVLVLSTCQPPCSKQAARFCLLHHFSDVQQEPVAQ